MLSTSPVGNAQPFVLLGPLPLARPSAELPRNERRDSTAACAVAPGGGSFDGVDLEPSESFAGERRCSSVEGACCIGVADCPPPGAQQAVRQVLPAQCMAVVITDALASHGRLQRIHRKKWTREGEFA